MTFNEEIMAHWKAYAVLVFSLLPDDNVRQMFADWIISGDTMRQLDYILDPQKAVHDFKQRGC